MGARRPPLSPQRHAPHHSQTRPGRTWGPRFSQPDWTVSGLTQTWPHADRSDRRALRGCGARPAGGPSGGRAVAPLVQPAPRVGRPLAPPCGRDRRAGGPCEVFILFRPSPPSVMVHGRDVAAVAAVCAFVGIQRRSARRQGGCVLVAGPRRDQGGSHEEDPVRHQGAEPEPPCGRGLASALAACGPRAPRDRGREPAARLVPLLMVLPPPAHDRKRRRRSGRPRGLEHTSAAAWGHAPFPPGVGDEWCRPRLSLTGALGRAWAARDCPAAAACAL